MLLLFVIIARGDIIISMKITYDSDFPIEFLFVIDYQNKPPN